MDRWSRLGDMSYSRRLYSVLLPRPHYLAATWAMYHEAVESFCPDTEVFTLLPISLPTQLELRCLSLFFANGELFLLTEAKQVARWVIGPGSQLS